MDEIEKIKAEYAPKIKESVKIDGVAGSIALEGEDVTVIVKTFITSLDSKFHITCNELFKILGMQYDSNKVNSLLVKIDINHTAYIYTNFPIQQKVRLKDSKKAGMPIFKNEIIDIVSVVFKDDLTSIDFKESDKIIWLFRNNWRFGLYFDFSKKINPLTLQNELARCYKDLEYYNLYYSISNTQGFYKMTQDGWFPFIQFIDGEFETLGEYYKLEDARRDKFIESFVKKYTNEKIKGIYERWWNKNVFNEKRDVLLAGIDAYLQGTKSGFINAIKTLTTEIEGIIRLSFFRELGANPSTKEMIEYISKKGNDRFNSVGSLVFPQFFFEYLKEYFFKGFNIGKNNLPNSRHSVAHGVLPSESYSMINAFKLILILDQIYFFLI